MIPGSNSKDFPDYFKGKNSVIIQDAPEPKPTGKRCYPDQKVGISQEFPDYFRHENQLISSTTKHNPLNDENHIKRSITNFKIAKHAQIHEQQNQELKQAIDTNQQGSKSALGMQNQSLAKGRNLSMGDIHKDGQQFTTKSALSKIQNPMFHEEELPKDNKLRASMRLLKHAKHIKTDENNIMQPTIMQSLDPKEHKQFDGEMVISASFKNFQDFNIKHEYEKGKQNQVKIELDKVPLYDCITNTEKQVQPPPIEIDSYSKLRENYYKMIGTVPKAFNIKQGMFTNYTDKTKPTRDKDNAYKLQKYEQMMGIQRNSMQDIKTSKILENSANMTLGNPYKRFNYNQYENMNQNHLQSHSILPHTKNFNTIDVDEDTSTKSIVHSMNKDMMMSSRFQTQNKIFVDSQTNKLVIDSPNNINNNTYTNKLGDTQANNLNYTGKIVNNTQAQLYRNSSTKTFHKKLEIQSQVLTSMLPYRQSVHDIKNVVEPKAVIRDPKRKITREQLEWLREQQDLQRERDRSIEEVKQIKGFENKLKQEIRNFDDSLDIAAIRTQIQHTQDIIKNTPIDYKPQYPVMSPSFLKNSGIQSNKFTRHSSMYFKTSLNDKI
ncbi:UNKNOWN [Stylonychia lemnae]|uniref:Uncharacterized protein n=1 Tax=Stylonychia lemnae TaxID=5949 RepID=A0A078BBK8_STYLE|nr:UNKNOWN [Stylonychia lemnae]|eukprot:CDW90948.1 UNKNOWN [Stylonychia lemnae]